MTYNLFIGRYQSPHKGHQTIFNEYLDKGLPVLIAIRDVATDDNNPLTAEEVKDIWEKIYEVKEIQVTSNIANISATSIRTQIKLGEEGWKEFVDEKGHELLKKLLIQS
jgi:nicotinic acid mononucleotide adenylyltransferase